MSTFNLENYLEENRVWHRFVHKSETVHTADAAKAAGVDLFRLTKNLVSETDQGEYVLLIVPGDRKVDLKAAAKALNVGWVRLVPFERAEAISGYPPGATPSFGHKTRMRTVVDEALLKYETIYCGGGSRDKILEFKPDAIMKLNNAVVASISKAT
jgi:Cys-tRNA(Pro)/Cys-tRNA(Cys) deacylase